MPDDSYCLNNHVTCWKIAYLQFHLSLDATNCELVELLLAFCHMTEHKYGITILKVGSTVWFCRETHIAQWLGRKRPSIYSKGHSGQNRTLLKSFVKSVLGIHQWLHGSSERWRADYIPIVRFYGCRWLSTSILVRYLDMCLRKTSYKTAFESWLQIHLKGWY